MISTSWSTPLSPGNSGWPSSSSAATQPVQTEDRDDAECPAWLGGICFAYRVGAPFVIETMDKTVACDEPPTFAPNIDGGRVVGGPEDELRCAVVPTADVGHIGLALDQEFGTAEVTELEDVRLGVEQQVLRLDVTVADAEAVDVCQCAGELVDVELDKEEGHDLFALLVLACHRVHGLRHIFQHLQAGQCLQAEVRTFHLTA